MRRFVEEADRGQWTLLPECLDDFIDRDFSASWRASPATTFGKTRELSNYPPLPPIGRQRKASCARNVLSKRRIDVRATIDRLAAPMSRHRPIVAGLVRDPLRRSSTPLRRSVIDFG